MRRWPVWIVAALLLGAGGYALARPYFKHAVRELRLPLQHEDIIRQQSADKDLDPALVAAVIYQESKFADRTSVAGARGLMQITPDTARFIANKSGGTRFTLEDLATPQINIAYGTYYLRYLLRRFNANVVVGLAAYNGGEGNVEKWLAAATPSARMSLTVPKVPSWVEPPAPKVTEQNSGRCA